MLASTFSSSPKTDTTSGSQPGKRATASRITSSPVPSGMPRSTSSTSGMVAVRASQARASCTLPALPSQKRRGLRCTLASKKARARLSSSTTSTPHRRNVPSS
jgi:hypothetical protein